MEIVRSQNARAISEFYPVEIFEFLKKKMGVVLLLYEFSRGNQVDGSPRVAITRRAEIFLLEE